MALFNTEGKSASHSGILGSFSVDVIKWEPETDAEASVLVHKFEASDFPNGSQLIVHPSQMAVFINNMAAGDSVERQADGKSQAAVFLGPCKIKLETGDSRFAPFRTLSHALTGGESAYHSTVYFINTTYMNELTWGTQAPIVVVDPEEEINVHVRAFGLFGTHIEQTDTGIASVQAMKFLRKVVGTRADYQRSELISFMRARILELVPDMLAKSVIENQIGVLKLSAHLSEFSAEMRARLLPHFDDFGLTLDNFSFHSINVPEEDLSAINEMKIRRKRAALEAEGTAVKMDIESAARARMREREGYTYQQEQSFDVLHAAAENEGTSGALMGAGMGLGMGMGVGGAFGAGLGDVARQAMAPASQAAAPSAEQIACPACQTKLPKDAKFCFGCGAKIEKEPEGIVCPDCGAKLPKGARFCCECGRKMAMVCPVCGAETGSGPFCMSCGAKL